MDWENLENTIEDPDEEDGFLMNSKKYNEYMERLSATTEGNETKEIDPVLNHRRKATHGRLSNLFTAESRTQGEEGSLRTDDVFTTPAPGALSASGGSDYPTPDLKSLIRSYAQIPLSSTTNVISALSDVCHGKSRG